MITRARSSSSDASPSGRCSATVTYEQRRDHGDDRGRGDVIGVAECMMHLVPLPAERPPGSGKGAAPDRRRGESQHRVAAERDAEYTGGDRDERPYERREPTEEHGPGSVAAEPALGAREPGRAEVQPFAVAVDESAAPV